MGILTADMKRVIEDQQLGFIATVCPDGTPNLSPKGTLIVSDDDHLMFADIRSPTTIANLRHQPALEINVVDVLARTGYRFKGVALVLGPQEPRFVALAAIYAARGSTTPKRHIVLMTVRRAARMISPAYDQGRSEAQVTAGWRSYWTQLWARR